MRSLLSLHTPPYPNLPASYPSHLISSHLAEPGASAKVSAICKNHRDQVTLYKGYQTDEHGYFYAQLDGFKMSYSLLDHPLQACHVKPVSSPLANCSLLSIIDNGLYGAPLRYKTTGTHYEAVVYATGPLAFRPNQCPADSPLIE